MLRCPWELRLAPGGGISFQPQIHFPPFCVIAAAAARSVPASPLRRHLHRSSSIISSALSSSCHAPPSSAVAAAVVVSSSSSVRPSRIRPSPSSSPPVAEAVQRRLSAGRARLLRVAAAPSARRLRPPLLTPPVYARPCCASALCPPLFCSTEGGLLCYAGTRKGVLCSAGAVEVEIFEVAAQTPAAEVL